MIGRIQKHARAKLDVRHEKNKAQRLAIYKRFLKLENEMIYRRHRAGESGLRIVALRSALFDVLIERLFDITLQEFEEEHGSPPSSLCVLALGGYGRGELSPLSDIDIMFLFPSDAAGKKVKDFQQFLTERILYTLWDLNLKVGHSARGFDDVFDEARKDIRTKTSMIESRRVAGSQELYETFRKAFETFYRQDNPDDYLAARLQDQTERRKRYGDTVFLQEPNIKNGVGGLRDYQNILWMARVKLDVEKVEDLRRHNCLRKNEIADFVQAYDFLLRVRNDLHFQLKRPSDLLNLDKQPLVALRLGYTQKNIFARVEAFMRDYYSHARTIHRYAKLVEKRLAPREAGQSVFTFSSPTAFAEQKETIQRNFDGFLLQGDKLTFESREIFENDPDRLIRAFRYCQRYRCALDFELESLIQESLPLVNHRVIHSQGANAGFNSILNESGSVFPALNAMHELGLLGRFVPEFGRLTCLVQHEFYHRYTADIHTLNTIRQLDDVFSHSDPSLERYRAVLRSLENPSLLYLILFLHDIGKSAGIAGHAKAGVEIASNILKRMDIKKTLWDLILFIIEHHLTMARIWQKHDIDDPDTIASFAELIGDAEKLGFLYVHTFCDARGTATSLWNSYKDTLHTTLYKSTINWFTRQEGIAHAMQKEKAMALDAVRKRQSDDVGDDEVIAHFELMPDRYFAQSDYDEIALHIRMINRCLSRIAGLDSEGSLMPVIEWREDINRSITVVHIVTWDRSGLFSHFAGAFALAGLNILTAKAFSRADHLAIDTFHVAEPSRGEVQSSKARKAFSEALKASLVENQDLLPQIRAVAEKAAATQRLVRNDEVLEAPIPPIAKVYFDADLGRAIVEIQANDRLGLLYLLTRAIFSRGFSITFARIVTERSVAIDTFYIEDASNPSADAPDKNRLSRLQADLEQVIDPIAHMPPG